MKKEQGNLEKTMTKVIEVQKNNISFNDGQQSALIRVTGLTKVFSGTVAVKDVDIEVQSGQIVAVVGENGAGKTTLKNLLCGILEPDQGKIEFEGKEISHFNAIEYGIAAVHQEFSLFGSLSVAENICIVDLPRRSGVLDWKEIYKIARKYLEIIGANLDLDIPVEKLSTGEQQLVEIAKALRQATKLLILDEPTASLTEPERDRLFNVIRRLRQHGLGIIFISHFIDEVYVIADRAVVLRDGRYVGGGSVENLPRNKLEELIVGRPFEERKIDIGTKAEEVVLKVEGLTLSPYFYNISFELKRGEILGLSGLMGAGRTELVEAIYGLRPSKGKVWFYGDLVKNCRPSEIKNLGVAFVPEDRRSDGLFSIRSLKENLTAAAISKLVRRIIPGFGFQGERQNALEIAKKFRVIHSGIDKAINCLSGGNQQKALLGRWLAIKPYICILDEPTRGVDIGAKEDIHALIGQFARTGTAILLVSSDLPELILLSHRIIVLRKGRMVNEFKRGNFNPRVIIKHAASAIEEVESNAV